MARSARSYTRSYRHGNFNLEDVQNGIEPLPPILFMPSYVGYTPLSAKEYTLILFVSELASPKKGPHHAEDFPVRCTPYTHSPGLHQSTAIHPKAGLGPQEHQVHQAQAGKNITPAMLSRLRLSPLRVPGHESMMASCYGQPAAVDSSGAVSSPYQQHQHLIPLGTSQCSNSNLSILAVALRVSKTNQFG